MKLPNAKNIVITKEKLVDYILSETHPTGKFKAKIFRKIGFDESKVKAFEKELKKIVIAKEITEKVESEYGIKYIIDGQIKGLKGKAIRVRTIWIIERGDIKPRFVTLYPV